MQLGGNRRIALIVLVILALVAGGVVAGILLTQDSSSGSGGRYAYPKTAQQTILSTCRKRSSGGYCACQLRAFQNTIPYPAYQTILSGGVGATLTTQTYWQAFQTESAGCH